MAHCETASDWKDRGRFAGGLGIYVGTWRLFGGTQFASSPRYATRIEQIVVANRISIFGWQSHNVYMTQADRDAHRPKFIQPVGFRGWGCHRVVGVPRNRPRIRP